MIYYLVNVYINFCCSSFFWLTWGGCRTPWFRPCSGKLRVAYLPKPPSVPHQRWVGRGRNFWMFRPFSRALQGVLPVNCHYRIRILTAAGQKKLCSSRVTHKQQSCCYRRSEGPLLLGFSFTVWHVGGWMGGGNVCCTCTLGWCYATHVVVGGVRYQIFAWKAGGLPTTCVGRSVFATWSQFLTDNVKTNASFACPVQVLF